MELAGLAGYTVVRKDDSLQMCLVRHEAYHEHCSCPNWEHRQSDVNAPCKHLLAAQLQAASDTSRSARQRTKLQQWQDEDEADARAAWDGPAFGNLNLPEAI